MVMGDVWEGVRKCDNPKEVCQLVGRCDHLAGSVTVIREV